MKIQQNSVVSFNYTLTLDDGTVVDSSTGSEPLTYVQGFGQIVPGLEEAMEGHSSGDAFKVAIPPAKGYGDRDESFMRAVPRSLFGDNPDLQEGVMFELQTPHGSVPVHVAELKEDTVVLDGNHPLAGKQLNFDISIVSIREATPEEMEAMNSSCGSGGCSSCSGCGHDHE